MNIVRGFIALSLFALIFLYGCINLDFLGGKPAQNVSAPTDIDKTPVNETGKVIIISETNTSVVHNATINTSKPPKPKGLQYSETPDSLFTVYFVAVAGSDEQGDAIIIKKGDADILVDAGPDVKAAELLDFLKRKEIDDIELLISTHADPEHYNGINIVADQYDVEQFWWVGNTYFDNAYDALVKKITAAGIPSNTIAKGSSITVNGMLIQVLNPQQLGGTGEGKDSIDNDAVVLKITDRDFCILLTSDILYGTQTKLTTTADLKCGIMQMPYHGLGVGNSQIDLFLLKVMPNDAIISGGPSDFSPADPKGSRFALYEKLKLRGVKYHANYLNGTVEVTSDGYSYSIMYE